MFISSLGFQVTQEQDENFRCWGDVVFPQEIVQHIASFLTNKKDICNFELVARAAAWYTNDFWKREVSMRHFNFGWVVPEGVELFSRMQYLFGRLVSQHVFSKKDLLKEDVEKREEASRLCPGLNRFFRDIRQIDEVPSLDAVAVLNALQDFLGSTPCAGHLLLQGCVSVLQPNYTKKEAVAVAVKFFSAAITEGATFAAVVVAHSKIRVQLALPLAIKAAEKQDDSALGKILDRYPKEAKKLASKGSFLPVVWYSRARHLSNLGQWSKADTCMDQALALYGEAVSLEILEDIFKIKFNTSNWEGALEIGRKILTLSDDENKKIPSLFLAQLALVHYNLDNLEESNKIYTDVFIEPGNLHSLVHVEHAVMCKLRLGIPQEAESLLERTPGFKNRSLWECALLAKLMLGEYSQALELCNACETHSEYSLAALAHSYYQLGEFKASFDYFRKACIVAFAPNRIATLSSLISCYEKALWNVDGAKFDIRMFINLSGARIHLQLGKVEEAKKYLNLIKGFYGTLPKSLALEFKTLFPDG